MAQNRKISQLPSGTPTTSDVGVMVQGGVTKQYSLNATPVSATIQAAIDAGTGAVDSVNGQTGVVVLTTADIADSTNKRYVTDANLTVIGNTSGTNTGDNATNTQYSGLATSKQDTLVSGTNIKTINSTSLLGSGNIDTTQTTITGNAGTATALQTARTIGTITGDATSAGSSFDGTANNTNSITVTKINGTSLAGLGTGILKNTTGTGVPSIALNSDLPVMTATVGGAVPTPPNNTTTFLRGDGTFATPSGGGTVTSVSVASANGLAGTVANATTTPAITLSTSITGVLKGNGTAISAATSGTDYSAGTSGLSTGILKSTTTTGALTIAVAGDFPTLNQSTTGSAATLTTPRAIYGNNFDGSAALTQVIASNYGGTGNGFTKISGPTTTERTKTMRDATDTILELGGSYTPTGTWTSMTLVTPALGTPASGVMTNVTGTATGLTSGITNALKSATTTVDVSAAAAPSAGKVLTATSSTAATWQTPTAAGFNSCVSANPSGTQTITTSTWTKVNFATEQFDVGSEFATSKFTATNTGYYSVHVALGWTDAGGGGQTRRVAIYKNGTLYLNRWVLSNTAAAPEAQTSFTDVISLSATDYIEIYTYQTTGSDQVVGTDSTWLNIYRVQ